MGKRELAQILAQAEWHDPTKWPRKRADTETTVDLQSVEEDRGRGTAGKTNDDDDDDNEDWQQRQQQQQQQRKKKKKQKTNNDKKDEVIDAENKKQKNSKQKKTKQSKEEEEEEEEEEATTTTEVVKKTIVSEPKKTKKRRNAPPPPPTTTTTTPTAVDENISRDDSAKDREQSPTSIQDEDQHNNDVTTNATNDDDDQFGAVRAGQQVVSAAAKKELVSAEQLMKEALESQNREKAAKEEQKKKKDEEDEQQQKKKLKREEEEGGEEEKKKRKEEQLPKKVITLRNVQDVHMVSNNNNNNNDAAISDKNVVVEATNQKQYAKNATTDDVFIVRKQDNSMKSTIANNNAQVPASMTLPTLSCFQTSTVPTIPHPPNIITTATTTTTTPPPSVLPLVNKKGTMIKKQKKTMMSNVTFAPNNKMCFYCETSHHFVPETLVLCANVCPEFLNDVSTKPLHAIKAKFPEGSRERVAVESALLQEISGDHNCGTQSLSLGQKTVSKSLNQVNDVMDAQYRPGGEMQDFHYKQEEMDEFKKTLKSLKGFSKVDDALGIYDAAATLSNFSKEISKSTKNSNGKTFSRDKSTLRDNFINSSKPPPRGEESVQYRKNGKKNGLNPYTHSAEKERKKKYKEDVKNVPKLATAQTLETGKTNLPLQAQQEASTLITKVEPNAALTLFSGGKWRLVEAEEVDDVQKALDEKRARQVGEKVLFPRDLHYEDEEEDEPNKLSDSKKRQLPVSVKDATTLNHEISNNPAKKTKKKTNSKQSWGSKHSIEGMELERVDPPVDGDNPILQPKRARFASNPSFGITRAMIEARFHMPLREAAAELNVGRTTFKRVLRLHGIERWPSQSLNAKQLTLKTITSLMSLPMAKEGLQAASMGEKRDKSEPVEKEGEKKTKSISVLFNGPYPTFSNPYSLSDFQMNEGANGSKRFGGLSGLLGLTDKQIMGRSKSNAGSYSLGLGRSEDFQNNSNLPNVINIASLQDNISLGSLGLSANTLDTIVRSAQFGFGQQTKSKSNNNNNSNNKNPNDFSRNPTQIATTPSVRAGEQQALGHKLSGGKKSDSPLSQTPTKEKQQQQQQQQQIPRKIKIASNAEQRKQKQTESEIVLLSNTLDMAKLAEAGALLEKEAPALSSPSQVATKDLAASASGAT